MPEFSQSELIQAFSSLVDEGKCLSDADSLETYGCDWTRFYTPAPSLVLLPKTTEQVQAIVKKANELDTALVPSGGRTGLSGGAVAKNGEIVIALDAMNQILDFDAASRTVSCQAGVVTEQLQHYAQEQDLFYPVDFASSGSSQIGGNIATNAGGIKVIRYGMTRQWVSGLTVVTGTGEVLELNNGLMKNATGYDLRHLFIGSEGTLGFITEAKIQLARQPSDLSVLVLGVPDFDAIMNVLKTFQKAMDLTAFEFFSHVAMQHVLDHGVPAPFDTQSAFYTLIEYENISDHTLDEVMALFETCMEEGWVEDGVISQNETQAQNLWQLRERISESITPYTPYKNDISTTIGHVKSMVEEIDAQVNEHYPEFEIVWFGHIGDGNMHLNILKPESLSTEDFKARCENVSEWVYATVEKYQGSISAEHGVGLLKKEYLQYSRSEAEIQLMRQIKQVFDPKGIMNPGKVI
ncbi:MAG: FAD-binding oxidoreductase [Pseudomonadota bacterium]|nr:FAD-binding oxidoreductase [Pseudomonadota bacterium]